MKFCTTVLHWCNANIHAFKSSIFFAVGAVAFVATQAQSNRGDNSTAKSSFTYAAFYQQKETNQKISLRVSKEKLVSVLEKIEKQVQYVFVYSNDEINASQKISLDVKDSEMKDVLELVMKQIEGQYEILKDKIIIRRKTTDGASAARDKTGTKLENVGNVDEQHAAIDLAISGQVLDSKGMPVEGVSVTLKGSSIGTVTDKNGRYTLNIPESKAAGVLVFSSVGFSIKEISIENKKLINATLSSSDNLLDDVVVIGYGTQKRVSVSGAVDAISKQSIQGRPVTNLSTALQGVSPNLIIQQRNFEPGQSVNINIRGLGTLGDNTPLVVIDGVLGGDLNLINPNDIESVSILKDAGSAAIYGSRSANGVILITSKKGRKNESPTVSYSGIYGMQSPRVTYEPVDAWKNAYYKNESLVNSGLQPAFTPAQIQEFATRGNGDWRVDNLLQNASQQSHNLTISGGSATSTYLISIGYLDQRNNFVGPDYGYKRYNIRFNQTNEIGHLKLNTILSYVKVQGKDHSYNAGTLIVDAGRVPLYYSYQDSTGRYLTNPVSAQFNPKAILEKGGYRNSNDDEIFGNLNAELSVTKELKLRGVFGGTVRSNSGFERILQLKFSPGGSYGDDRRVTDGNYKSLFTNLQLFAEYSKRINEHSFNLLLGVTNESFIGERSVVVNTQTDSSLGTPTSGSPNLSSNTVSGTQETSLNSALGRLNYSFMDRYFAELVFRYDGSSKFAEANRWGFFPSISASWRLTEEAFLADVKNKIGDLKLRVSYGVLGNQNVNAYQYQTSFFNYNNAYSFNNNIVSGAGYRLGNPDLTWEKASTFNIGIDAALLKRRLAVSFDYFDKTTRDILYTRRDVPQLFGAGFPDYNVAEVKNRGWDLKISYSIPGKIFNHNLSINIADNLNELLALTSGATEQIERKEEFELVRRVGQPITVYQGYKRNGYFQNLDDMTKAPKPNGAVVTAGDIKFADKNGDGVIDDRDKFILGNPFPRYTFGFTYTLEVKGFDLMLFVQGVGQRDAMIRGEQVEPFHVGYGGTLYTHQTDYWTPTNPNAKYPRLAENGSPSNTNNYRTGSDVYQFDASYARLKNLQIGYSLPRSVLEKIKIQRARVYFTGQNLLTLSKLDFLDPEITEFDNNTSFQTGANSARAYFLPVFYGFGLDITF